MNIDKESPWSFYGQWLVACTLGFTVAGMLSLPLVWGLAEGLEKALGETAAILIAGALFGLFWGSGLGTGQWLVLQNRLGGTKWWVPVTAIAPALGMAAMFSLLVDEGLADPWIGLLIGGTFGIALGIGQWLILRRQLPGAGWWIVINALGLTVALTVSLSLDGEGRELLAFGTAGLLIAAITGLGMLWLLRRSVALA